jgi:60 kDa SS-A/Ro ribonucleoprotein
MSDALSKIQVRNAQTPQTEQADERQVKNNTGGYTFTVSEEAKVMRFLTLGVDGGTYYQAEREYTIGNAQAVIKFAQDNGTRLVELILEVSEAGRAPRQNPALFALAAVFAFGDAAAKEEAKDVFNAVVRTGTHLFLFVQYTEQLRGWGRCVKNAVADWYLAKDAKALSYQMLKYRQRNGWTHRDVLRSAHPKTTDPAKNTLFQYATHPEYSLTTTGNTWLGPYLHAQALGNSSGDKSKVYAKVIRENPGMPWEMLPDEALTFPATWGALLEEGMPIGALIRQLPRLTNLGITGRGTVHTIVNQLTDEDALRKGRVHPVKLLYALKTYSSGHSAKGSGSWTPSQRVVDALDQAFYLSFKTMEPSGKRTLLAMDVSGSMSWGGQIVTPAEGSMAMAMATAATEQDYEIMGFANTFRALDVSPRRRLDDNLASIRNMSFGSTDCSLPMTWAFQQKREFDTFVVYTDNETYAGNAHPHQALQQYRRATGIDAKLIVVGMTATDFTIADPTDPGMLDVAGFDADTPSVISGFSRGDFG